MTIEEMLTAMLEVGSEVTFERPTYSDGTTGYETGVMSPDRGEIELIAVGDVDTQSDTLLGSITLAYEKWRRFRDAHPL